MKSEIGFFLQSLIILVLWIETECKKNQKFVGLTHKDDGMPKSQGLNDTCSSDYLRTYKLKGVIYGNTTDPFLICPTLKSNCCSKYDQRYIFHFLQEVMPQKLFELKARRDIAMGRLHQLHQKVMKTAPNYTAIGEERGEFCQKKWKEFEEYDIAELFGDYQGFSDNWISERSDEIESFYCMMCDGKNQKFLQLNKPRIIVKQEFCLEFLDKHQEDLLFWNKQFINYLEMFQHVVDCNHYSMSFNLTFFDRTKLLDKRLTKACLAKINKGFPRACQRLCNKVHFASLTELIDGDIAFIEEVVNLFSKENFNQERGRFITMQMRDYYKRYQLIKTLNLTQQNIFRNVVSRAQPLVTQIIDAVDFFDKNYGPPRRTMFRNLKQKLENSSEKDSKSTVKHKKKDRKLKKLKKYQSPFANPQTSDKQAEFLKDKTIFKLNDIYQQIGKDESYLLNRRRLQGDVIVGNSSESMSERNIFGAVRSPNITMDPYLPLAYDNIVVPERNLKKDDYVLSILTRQLDVDKLRRRFRKGEGLSLSSYKPQNLQMDEKAFIEMLFHERQSDLFNRNVELVIDSVPQTMKKGIREALTNTFFINPSNYIVSTRLGIGSRKLKQVQKTKESKKNRSKKNNEEVNPKKEERKLVKTKKEKKEKPEIKKSTSL